MATTITSLPPRILAIMAVVAGGCILSFLLDDSTEMASPQQNHLLLRSQQDGHRRRTLSQLDAFNDPKTVQLRPAVNLPAQTDAAAAPANNYGNREMPLPPAADAAAANNNAGPTNNMDAALIPFPDRAKGYDWGNPMDNNAKEAPKRPEGGGVEGPPPMNDNINMEAEVALSYAESLENEMASIANDLGGMSLVPGGTENRAQAPPPMPEATGGGGNGEEAPPMPVAKVDNNWKWRAGPSAADGAGGGGGATEMPLDNNEVPRPQANLEAQQQQQQQQQAQQQAQQQQEQQQQQQQEQQAQQNEMPPVAANNEMMSPPPNNAVPPANNDKAVINASTEGIIPPYNIDNALATTEGFRYTLFFFIYDALSDSFSIFHNIQGCAYGCARIPRAASVVAYALRKTFPVHFSKPKAGEPPEATRERDLVIMMSTGDAPRIHNYCLRSDNNYCHSVDYAPILQFGSVFQDTNLLPSMIAMPMPVRPHLPCFDEWQYSGKDKKHVCNDLQPKKDLSTKSTIKEGIVFGEELGLLKNKKYWEEDLIPQIVWRGTDFVFLHTMYPNMRSPTYDLDIAPHYQESFPRDGSPEDDQRWAIKTLWESMGNDKLLPRWRGVLMTSEAELEARIYQQTIGEEAKLPWVNIKFASINVDGLKMSAAENPEYQILHNLGIAAIGEHLNMTTQARYKYHIDLGGGGGTTWTGTIEKLALPGVLFHHVTPTKDYFHDFLVPWKHYIPIKEDLSDLREKYEWAENNPDQAKRIAEAGTEFARWIGSVEGFGKLYEETFMGPLRNVIRAYKPMPPKYAGKSALDVITEVGQEKGFSLVAKCSGEHMNSCEQLA